MQKLLFTLNRIKVHAGHILCFLLIAVSLYSQSAVARRGGADGGGGNAYASEPIKLDLLQEILREPRKFLVPALNWQDLQYHLLKIGSQGDSVADPFKIRNNEVLWNGLSKLYANSSVYSELKSVRFNLLLEGPCRDLHFADRDASAFNSNSDEICISKDRLLEKLNTNDYIIEVVALLVHELVHRVGGTETEAVAVQELVRASVVYGNKPLWQFSGLPQFYKEVQFVRWQFDSLTAQVAGRADLNPVKTCLTLSRLSEAVRGLARVSDPGLHPVDFKTAITIDAARLQADNLLNYCHVGAAENKIVELAAERYLNKAVLVKDIRDDYRKTHSPKATPTLFTEEHGYLQGIRVGDWRALKYNIHLMKDNLRKITTQTNTDQLKSESSLTN